MNTKTQHTKKINAELLQYGLLVGFTLFALYFSISSYRLSHMQTYDLTSVTNKAESVVFKKAKGKQAKAEVWIDLGISGKFRVAYGTNNMLHALAKEVKKGEVITVYLKKAQHVFINLGMDNDVLQIAKSGQVIYSLDIPQKSFQNYYVLSAIMSFLLPLGCVFYWIKSKSNAVLERLQTGRLQQTQLSAE